MTDLMTKGNIMNNEYYVYEHHRASDGSVFYVGMGRGKRFKTKDSRNIHWKRIVAKHGFLAKIIASGLTLEEAYQLEIDTILAYGKENLCNITDGGDGVRNPSEETRKKMSNAKMNKRQSSEHIKSRVEAIRRNPSRKNKTISNFRGVVWNKKAKKWQAQVSVDGRCVYLGVYECKFEAWLKVLKYKGAVSV